MKKSLRRGEINGEMFRILDGAELIKDVESIPNMNDNGSLGSAQQPIDLHLPEVGFITKPTIYSC